MNKPRTLLCAAALAASACAHAAPFLWANVTADADVCVYTVQGGTPVESPVLQSPTGMPAGMGPYVCHVDLANAAAGTNNITLAAKSTIWGVTSSAVPFSFARLVSTSPPASLRLAP